MSQASLVQGLPNCAQNCITSTGPSTQCSPTDVKCLCGTSDYSLRLGCCLAQNCNTNDQQSAIEVTQGICKTVGVNLPDFVSCNADYTSAVNSAVAAASSEATDSSSKSTGKTTSKSAAASSSSVPESTVGSIEPGVVLPATQTLVSFTGKSILTGSCTTPQFALVTQGDGFLEYPWLGCSNLFPDCCPFDLRDGGILSICPADYTTISKTGCCPSGYSIYSTAIAGNTPCVTTPILPLVPPGATTNPAVSVIRTQLFALQYTLSPHASSSKTSLPTGGIIGVALGSFSLLSLLLAGSLILFRRRRAARLDLERENSKRGPTNPRPISEAPTVDTSLFRNWATHPIQTFQATRSQASLGQAHLAELESPGPTKTHFTELGEMSPETASIPPKPWDGAGAGAGGVLPRALSWSKPGSPTQPVEMAGDHYIHAHHPSGVGSEVEAEYEQQQQQLGRGRRKESGDNTLKEVGTPGLRSPGFDAVAFSGSSMGGMVMGRGSEDGGSRNGKAKGEEIESPVLGNKGENK